MTDISLTQFDVTKKGYRWAFAYKAMTSGFGHSIMDYMTGLVGIIRNYSDSPRAWSFCEWKRGDNSMTNWLHATAIALEYKVKPGTYEDRLTDLNERVSALGYRYMILDSQTRAGKQTLSFVFPLTETINSDQYARLAAVLMEEIGAYGAAEGNMAATHLVHVHERCAQEMIEGAILHPRSKINETEKLYQVFDPCRFEAWSAAAGAQISMPTVTSHDGLFEWSAADADQMIRADPAWQNT
ncbi:hypothetical protein [Sphingomonas oryzagri]